MDTVLDDTDALSLESIRGSTNAFSGGPKAQESLRGLLSWILGLLSESPVARSLWSDALEAGWKIRLADLEQRQFHLDIAKKTLVLNNFSLSQAGLVRSPYFRNTLLAAMIGGLRDIWHEENGHTFEARYNAEHVLLLERVRAADTDMVTLLAAWELRSAGYAALWRHILGGENGDLADLFVRTLENDPASLFNGKALARIFRQWFADARRIDGCDHETLEMLDAEYDGTPLNGHSKEKPGADLIESLSCLPGGLLYLEGIGGAILTDPFFTGLGDPLNQAHLFHIMQDHTITIAGGVAFRDAGLAQKLFPGEGLK